MNQLSETDSKKQQFLNSYCGGTRYSSAGSIVDMTSTNSLCCSECGLKSATRSVRKIYCFKGKQAPTGMCSHHDDAQQYFEYEWTENSKSGSPVACKSCHIFLNKYKRLQITLTGLQFFLSPSQGQLVRRRKVAHARNCQVEGRDGDAWRPTDTEATKNESCPFHEPRLRGSL